MEKVRFQAIHPDIHRYALKMIDEVIYIDVIPKNKIQFMQKRGVQKCMISAWLSSYFLQVMG